MLAGLKLDNPTAERFWELDLLRVDRDGSLSELLEYALLVLAAVATFRVGRLLRSATLKAMAALYVYLLADNALRLHETISLAIPTTFKHEAEAVYMIAIAAAAAALVIGAVLADRGELSVIALANAVGFGSIILFAIAADFAHAVFGGVSRQVNYALGFIEDGGELLVIVMMGCYGLSILSRFGPALAHGGSRTPPCFRLWP